MRSRKRQHEALWAAFDQRLAEAVFQRMKAPRDRRVVHAKGARRPRQASMPPQCEENPQILPVYLCAFFINHRLKIADFADAVAVDLRLRRWLHVPALAVFMAMVDVRVVRMPVPKRFMPVPVGMRLGDRPLVRMAMMVVVDMGMLVLDGLVRVVMGMAFGQMQPDAEGHQQARNDQLRIDRLAY